MADQFVLRAFYSQGNTSFPDAGWSEIYWLQGINYTDNLVLAAAIVTGRLGLAPASVHCEYAYISNINIKGDSLAVFTTPQDGTFSAPGDYAAPPEIALRIRMQSGPLYHIIKPLHGLPANLMVGPNFVSSSLWDTAFLTWKAAIVTGASINAKDKVTHVKTYFAIDQIINTKVTRSHRVGRPFDQYRGRRLAS